jgi:hypothetical protein
MNKIVLLINNYYIYLKINKFTVKNEYIFCEMVY